MRLPMVVVVAGVALLGFASWACAADDEKEEGGKERKVEVADVPKAVMKAVQAKFPNAKVRGAGTEEENGETFYELNLKDGEQTVDVLVEEDGEIVEIERTIAADDLPAAVKKAIKAKYPAAKIKKAEKVVALEEDDEEEGNAGKKAGQKEDDDDDAAAAKKKSGSKKKDAGSKQEDADENGGQGKKDAEDEDDEEEEGDVAYEVVLVTDEGTTVEVKFSPDGKKAAVDEDNEEENEKADKGKGGKDKK